MAQTVVYSTSGYGNVAHIYPFSAELYALQDVYPSDPIFGGKRVRFKNHMDLFDEQVRILSEENGMAIQCTLTDSQVASSNYEWVLKALQKNKFRAVFAHRNPNTRRVIHTFMRMSEKMVKWDDRAWDKSLANEKLKLNGGGYPYGSADGHIFAHSGGCCGWMQIRQPVFDVKAAGNETHDRMIRVAGELAYFSGTRATATQLFIDSREESLTNNWNSYGGYLETLGFERVLSFPSGHDGSQICWWVRYQGEKFPLFTFPKAEQDTKAGDNTPYDAEHIPLAAGNTF